MIKKKPYQELKFWIGIIGITLVFSNVGISLTKPDWYTKIGLFISLNASLLGGLITLISIFITNQYYNKQKVKSDIDKNINKIQLKINTLKYFKDETLYNKEKANEVEINKNPIRNEVFQTIVYEASKNLILETFIECGQDLQWITKFYYDISSC